MTIEATKYWFGFIKGSSKALTPKDQLVHFEEDFGLRLEQKRIIVDTRNKITVMEPGQEPVVLFKEQINQAKVSICGPGINPNIFRTTHISWRK